MAGEFDDKFTEFLKSHDDLSEVEVDAFRATIAEGFWKTYIVLQTAGFSSEQALYLLGAQCGGRLI